MSDTTKEVTATTAPPMNIKEAFATFEQQLAAFEDQFGSIVYDFTDSL